MVRAGAATALKRGQAGHVLIFALFVIVLTLAASMLIASAMDLRLRLVRRQAQDLHLTALCDAAMAKALAELETSSFYRGTNAPIPFSDGTLMIAVQPRDGLRVEVDVLASYAGRRRRALAEVRLDPPTVVSWQPIAP